MDVEHLLRRRGVEAENLLTERGLDRLGIVLHVLVSTYPHVAWKVETYVTCLLGVALLLINRTRLLRRVCNCLLHLARDRLVRAESLLACGPYLSSISPRHYQDDTPRVVSSDWM